jgi:hypothetical protein
MLLLVGNDDGVEPAAGVGGVTLVDDVHGAHGAAAAGRPPAIATRSIRTKRIFAEPRAVRRTAAGH